RRSSDLPHHRRSASSSTPLFVHESVHGVTEPCPLGNEVVERTAPPLRQAVVAAWRSARGLLPSPRPEPVPPEPAQQGIDRPFARDHAVGLRQGSDDVEPVTALVPK